MADPQPPLSNASYNPSFTVNRSQAEQAIYIELLGDTRFPSITSTVVTDWPDNTQAYLPSDKKLGSNPLSGQNWSPSNPPPALTANVIYPKFAQLQYVVNSSDFILGQGGFTSLAAGTSAYGTFSALHLLAATTFNGLTATGSTVGALTGTSLAAGIIYGPFTGVAVVAGGPAIAYNV